MRSSMTVKDLMTGISTGVNPNKIVYEGDLETYVWNGSDYVGVNNERSFIKVLFEEGYTLNQLTRKKLVAAK